MSKPGVRRGTFALAAVASLLVAAFAAVPAAQASTLYACVTKSGTAHVFTKKPKKCKSKKEKLVSWNTTGPAGKNGANGTNGTSGTNGKEGAAGQPQKAVSFNVSSNFGPTITPLFSVGGVSVRLDCASFGVSIPELEASAPTGSFAETGLVVTNANGKAPEVVQESLVSDVPLTPSSPTIIMKMTANVHAPVANIAHLNGSISTPTSVVFLDAFVEAGEEGPSACTVRGSAFTIPT
jgi:hypothetical protein